MLDNIKRLLTSKSEEDIKISSVLMAQRPNIQEELYAHEDINVWTKKMQLDKVKWLLDKYPNLIVTGSIALFLHGCRIKRWAEPYFEGDIDLVLPYYFPIEGEKINMFYEQSHPSGSDFQEYYNFDGVKMDTRVDPMQRYEHIKYGGYTYRVSDVFDIITAKIKYAKLGGTSAGKHKQDLYDIIGKTVFTNFVQKVEEF